ncbi:unannotated protein [freshwater metagenome]|uniref:Unannotated protein n=1 Tax=freshwater metagenome TaxID=449393 RepID=A0A6J7CXQ6_9ZZZZ|nr:sulfur carrier protein ThiS [Actinomycetota bacterium]
MIRLNGTQVEGRDGATVGDLLADLGVESQARGVAVAVDGEIIPRSEWGSHTVPAGASVEAVTAVQGG